MADLGWRLKTRSPWEFADNRQTLPATSARSRLGGCTESGRAAVLLSASTGESAVEFLRIKRVLLPDVLSSFLQNPLDVAERCG